MVKLHHFIIIKLTMCKKIRYMLPTSGEEAPDIIKCEIY